MYRAGDGDDEGCDGEYTPGTAALTRPDAQGEGKATTAPARLRPREGGSAVPTEARGMIPKAMNIDVAELTYRSGP